MGLFLNSIFLFQAQDLAPRASYLLMLFFFPMTIGGYMINNALKNHVVLEVSYDKNIKDVLSLRNLKIRQEAPRLTDYLERRNPGRFFVDVNVKSKLKY
jgi:hypothetical protein